MNKPTYFETRPVGPDTTALISYLPVPGFGVLPVNAFVIAAKEPVLVDTGLAVVREDFMQALRDVVDPLNLRWIWITHADADHVGNLQAVLDAAPNARIVTNFLGMGKLAMQQLPLDRVFLLNPNQHLSVGDRLLQAVAPPSYDAPETTGLYDPSSQSLFSADCFGALLETPVSTAADIPAGALREGSIAWASVDAPWLQLVDTDKFRACLAAISTLKARTVFSSHLPPACDMIDRLLQYLADARRAPAFVGPDQRMLENMLAA
jgi:glyoxylase-like metal-dependent hydrolase (beta-lactamase superfamily II)